MSVFTCFSFFRRFVCVVDACRPRQWTKNLLVYASAIFAFTLNPSVWSSSTIAFVAFCLTSSSVYLFNDLMDRESDRLHPIKRLRPIASGRLSPAAAITVSSLLCISSLLLGWLVSQGLAWVLVGYLFIQLFYCIGLKREPLLDLFCIASGFLLRAIAGLVATGLDASPWFLLTIGLLALFLAVEKRKAELRLSLHRGVVTRHVLMRYSLSLLQRLESLVASSAFMAYALWSAGPTLGGATTSWMLLTVPFVIAGIFRYQLLSDPAETNRRCTRFPERSCEKPEEILLSDHGIQLILMGWLLSLSLIGVSHRLGWID